MLYKLGKNTLKALQNICHFIQIVLIFLAFFTILYWILELAQVPWVTQFSFIFEPIKTFTHTFYNRTLYSSGSPVDFAFLIASFVMLLIVWALNFLISIFEKAEAKYDKIHSVLRKREEDEVNAELSKNSTKLEKNNNKFIILVGFNLANILYDVKYGGNADDITKDKLQEVVMRFSKEAQSLTPLKKTSEDSVILSFNNFEEIDLILTKLFKILKRLKDELTVEKWKLSYIAGIEVYSKDADMLTKCNNLFAIKRLNIKNTLCCLASFNQRYTLITKPSFEVSGLGIYKIGENELDVYKIHKKTN